MTLFPEAIEKGLDYSILKRARENNLIDINTINIRDYTNNKHLKVDDYPYGGGAGMVMQVQPVVDAYNSISKTTEKKTRVIYMTPWGHRFNQKMAIELAKEEELVFLCGHYEGIDERALEMIVTDYVSIGDYVLTGGEMPAVIMIDAISRLVPGVLGNESSAENESFSDNLLEHPQYSRPAVYMDKKVPDVLLSGDHKKIEEFKRLESIKRTAKYRPDLLKEANLTEKEKKFLQNLLWYDKVNCRVKKDGPLLLYVLWTSKY